ncbi:hypothetical protein RRG08_013023 [Elysia crispata]|uniref:Uncharacterized protein n=1 Tax=Elysia crispata TaxID=231223 RepID=A0AAE1A1W8_9GAST|nr:hypothetical protein RRG08_013023 [Elysia crispata]
MGGTRRLGQGRLSRLSPEQQVAEKLLFRQQTQMLNRIIQSDHHYLPLYKRRWSSQIHSGRDRSPDTNSQDSSGLVLALPSTRKPSAHVSGSSQDVKAKDELPRMSSSFEECQKVTRLRNSRSHGHRLHCEVLGQEVCHKCLRNLDQAAMANRCLICLSSTQIPLSLTRFASMDSLSDQRNNMVSRCQTGNSLHSSIQIFNRVRQKDIKKKNVFTPQERQPMAIMFRNEDKRSSLPSQNHPNPIQRRDSQSDLDPPEAFSTRNFEFKVKVTFGKSIKTNIGTK